MATIVTLPYDPEWKALAWAKEHCPSYITNNGQKIAPYMYDYNNIDYFFSNERDAALFSLRWI